MVLTPFHHVYGNLGFQDEVKDLLVRQDIPFFTATSYDLSGFRPHVTFLQNPYHDTRPECVLTEALRDAGIRVAYIPYGLDIGGGGANLNYQYNLATHKTAWRIFARSARHRRMFAKYCETGSGHVVVTGHPKIDAIGEISSAQVDPVLMDRIAGRRVVLWTPHFSVGAEPAWSTFELYSEAIFTHLRQREDLFLIVRPHPLFFQAMRKAGLFTSESEGQFRQQIATRSNLTLDESRTIFPRSQWLTP